MSLVTNSATEIDSNPVGEEEFISDELIVKLATDFSPAEMRTFEAETDLDISVIDTTQTLDIQLWEVDDVSVEEAIEVLDDDPRIEYVEPNFIGTYTETIPDDPSYEELWGLNNTGQTGGLSDADIDAPEAWDIQTGNNVIVGVLDSGIDVNHLDLVDNLWTNPGEIPGNGIDDDSNGYVDDVHGYDFGNNDPDPEDNYVHGTHVSGTIAAQGNNGIGVTGVNWNARVMMLKIGDSGPETFAAIQALEYSIMMGVRVTNNSWTVPDSQALRDAIAAAGENEQLFVAAAGNSLNDNDLFPSYPASYDLDNIISVAATDENDELAWFSNFGATSVDLGAPGTNILSTTPGNNYDFFDGTSMASPHVVGVASLLLAEDPSLSTAEVKQLILDNTDPISSLEGITVTGGRLNAFKALSEVQPPLEIIGTAKKDVLIGTNRRDIISGLGGNDVIEGLAGDDTLSGGRGKDLIAGGKGNDIVTGDGGNDDIVGGQGNDSLDGNGGADRILGESGADTLNGGFGNDTLNGGADRDLINGGRGSDRISGGSEDDVLNGDGGRDTLTGGSGNDALDGGADSDRLSGVNYSTKGMGESDTLTGGGGRDTFVLGNEEGVFYDDGDALTRGASDFALVIDFNVNKDSIQLYGSAEFYSLDFFTSEVGTIDADLIYDPGVAARGEVIAILQDVPSDLAIDDSAFTFV